MRIAQEARKLWELGSSREASPAPSFQPGADAQLTILLTPVAHGLRVEYSIQSQGVFRHTFATNAALSEARAGGEALFRLLFPGDEWAAALATATGASVPSPARCALRVRVLVTEPSLAELPFHRVAWEGAPLSLWTFECTRSEQAAPPTELRTPCRINACVPSAPHREALREVLRRISPHQADEAHLHLCHPLASVLDLLGVLVGPEACPNWISLDGRSERCCSCFAPLSDERMGFMLVGPNRLVGKGPTLTLHRS